MAICVAVVALLAALAYDAIASENARLALPDAGAGAGAGGQPPEAEANLATGWLPVDPVEVGPPVGQKQISGTPSSGFNDGVTLVNFWASTCAPCKHELPILQEVNDGGIISVVGVTRDQFAEYADEATAEAGVTYPNWIDPQGDYTYSMADLIPPAAVPSSILLIDGTARAVHIGPFDSAADVIATAERYSRKYDDTARPTAAR